MSEPLNIKCLSCGWTGTDEDWSNNGDKCPNCGHLDFEEAEPAAPPPPALTVVETDPNPNPADPNPDDDDPNPDDDDLEYEGGHLGRWVLGGIGAFVLIAALVASFIMMGPTPVVAPTPTPTPTPTVVAEKEALPVFFRIYLKQGDDRFWGRAAPEVSLTPVVGGKTIATHKGKQFTCPVTANTVTTAKDCTLLK